MLTVYVGISYFVDTNLGCMFDTDEKFMLTMAKIQPCRNAESMLMMRLPLGCTHAQPALRKKDPFSGLRTYRVKHMILNQGLHEKGGLEKVDSAGC
jgi:hypothetical protein